MRPCPEKRHAHLILQEARIENQIRALSRRLRGSGQVRATLPTSREDTIDRLGDRRLISYFRHDRDIHAVSVHQGSVAMQRIIGADAPPMRSRHFSSL